jgi:hypothetical protein
LFLIAIDTVIRVLGNQLSLPIKNGIHAPESLSR